MSEQQKRQEQGKRNTLGRGLSALFGEATEDYGTAERARSGGKSLPVEFLHPGRFQPRRRFDEDAIAEMVQSVREKGILQPLLVRRDPDHTNSYEIIAGERRWRAAQAAGLHEVPVVIRELTDREALEISIIENVQRQDLTPLEEADGYRRLLEEFKHTQEDLARALGKSRSHIANTLRLLALPDAIKAMVNDGSLTAGHARALLGAGDPVALAEEVVACGYNVRQTEALVRDRAADSKTGASGSGAGSGDREGKDADLVRLEKDISAELGLKVTISGRGQAGTIAIRYKTLDQFDDLLRRLRGE